MVVSDASGRFNDDHYGGFIDFITRNIRVANLMMDRVGQLERQALAQVTHQVVRTIRIRFGSALSSEKLEALRGFRTDLDRFSPVEHDALIYHGYVAAEETLRGVIPDGARPGGPTATVSQPSRGSVFGAPCNEYNVERP